MTGPERAELVRYRLLRAHEAMSEAQVLMQQAFWRGSVNRIYYAVFYATIAALAARESHPKTHKGVRQQFNLLFVNEGLVSKGLGDAYSELFELRHSNDYDDFVRMDEEQVKRLHEHAVELLKTIEVLLRR